MLSNLKHGEQSQGALLRLAGTPAKTCIQNPEEMCSHTYPQNAATTSAPTKPSSQLFVEKLIQQFLFLLSSLKLRYDSKHGAWLHYALLILSSPYSGTTPVACDNVCYLRRFVHAIVARKLTNSLQGLPSPLFAIDLRSRIWP